MMRPIPSSPQAPLRIIWTLCAAGGGGSDQHDFILRAMERAAAEGSALVLGPKAVLTPLGRDRARALGVTIQREAAC